MLNKFISCIVVSNVMIRRLCMHVKAVAISQSVMLALPAFAHWCVVTNSHIGPYCGGAGSIGTAFLTLLYLSESSQFP